MNGDAAKNIISIASNIAVILGIPIFLFQQYSDFEQNRRRETLFYVNIFQEERLVDNRRLLLRPWTEVSIPGLIDAGASVQDLDRIVLLQSREDEHLSSAIFEMVDFLDSVGLCVDSFVCDEDLSKIYFLKYASHFWCIYGGYIVSYRERFSIADFGEITEKFVGGRNLCFLS